MNMHQIVAMVAAMGQRFGLHVPKSEAAVKAAKKAQTISPARWFHRPGKSWTGKKSNRRTWAARKAKLRRRTA